MTQELRAEGTCSYFVKKLITLSLDGTDKQREMASALLSEIQAKVDLHGSF